MAEAHIMYGTGLFIPSVDDSDLCNSLIQGGCQQTMAINVGMP